MTVYISSFRDLCDLSGVTVIETEELRKDINDIAARIVANLTSQNTLVDPFYWLSPFQDIALDDPHCIFAKVENGRHRLRGKTDPDSAYGNFTIYIDPNPPEQHTDRYGSATGKQPYCFTPFSFSPTLHDFIKDAVKTLVYAGVPLAQLKPMDNAFALARLYVFKLGEIACNPRAERRRVQAEIAAARKTLEKHGFDVRGPADEAPPPAVVEEDGIPY